MPKYKGYTCYLIQVIQQTPHDDVPWEISQHGVQDNIRIISASRVYALSTGDDQAFPKFLDAVIEVLKQKHNFQFDGEDYHELSELATRVHGFSF